MSDYSDIPPLVDGPSHFPPGFVPGPTSPPQRRAYASTPYPATPPSMPSSTPPWPTTTAAGDAGAAAWGAFNANQQPSSPPPGWAAQAAAQPAFAAGWGGGGPQAAFGIMTAPFYPAPLNPALPYQAEGLTPHLDDARAADTAEWAAMTASGSWKTVTDEDGFPRRSGSRLNRAASTSRSLTPYTQTGSSQTSSPSSGSIGSLSFSSGRSRSVQLDEAFKRPPREWRADFSMTRGPGFVLGQIGSLLSFPTRRPSFSRSDSLSAARATLHPFLRYNSSHPPMFLDLRSIPRSVRFRELQRNVNEWDLTRFACEPPQARMRLYHTHWPWVVDVVSANPAGVTIGELLAGIWQSMQTPIAHADYWNNEMDERVREDIAAAWAQRTANDPAEQRHGVRRVDYLIGRTVLEGIVKGKDGMWEMKLRRL